MIKSMTGFGSYTYKYQDTTYNVDIRCVNSKLFDFSIKIPTEFKDKESEIRKIISTFLERGKIDCSISVEKEDVTTNSFSINSAIIKKHFNELKNIVQELNLSVSDSKLLSMAIQIPDVVETPKTKASDEEWQHLELAIKESCRLTDNYRISEGKAIKKDFKIHINLILKHLNETEKFEKERIQSIKSRLLKALNDLSDQRISYDKNRFEQELLFYIEKLDFTEEKARLKKHCEYFMETMKEDTSNGKKLSFICQEMGREINTLGAKSLEYNIQQNVVQMKDELEKIKEQLANIL